MGLDFGTSNSVAGFGIDQEVSVVPIDDQGKGVMPSTLFYHTDLETYFFGNTANNMHKIGTSGRYLKSLKSILGSSLQNHQTRIGSKEIPLTQLIAIYINNIKNKVEAHYNSPIDSVVAGRPVFYSNVSREVDKASERAYEDILRSIGFKNILFEYEPIAAAYSYEQDLQEETLALIVDLGGGTSDFSLVRLHPKIDKKERAQNILGYHSVHVAGDDFDREVNLATIMTHLGYKKNMDNGRPVPHWIYTELSTWEKINLFMQNNSNHMLLDELTKQQKNKVDFINLKYVVDNQLPYYLLGASEQVKIGLSGDNEIHKEIKLFNPAINIQWNIDQFNNAINHLSEKIIQALEETLRQGGVTPKDVRTIFFTGGTSQIPLIRDRILSLCSQSKVIEGDTFSSVGHGLTLKARELFA